MLKVPIFSTNSQRETSFTDNDIIIISRLLPMYVKYVIIFSDKISRFAVITSRWVIFLQIRFKIEKNY